MRFKKINYRIHHRVFRSIPVIGYAVNDPQTGVRYCVRQVSRRYWKADHFDSGLSLDVFAETRKEVAFLAKKRLLAAIKNGSYAAAINSLNARGTA